MSRTKAQLRFGLWPDSPAAAHHSAGLTVAARRLAEAALEELGKFGVVVTLDDEGKARFRSIKPLPPAAMRTFETHADLIEAYLIERAPRLIQPQLDSAQGQGIQASPRF